MKITSNSIHKPIIRNNTYNSNNFKQILNQLDNNNKVKFSKHAKDRIENRNISFDKEEINKINDALNKAKKKGIKDSLILMNKKAVIANVSTKTIITVATENDLKENIFTNIDGAVII